MLGWCRGFKELEAEDVTSSNTDMREEGLGRFLQFKQGTMGRMKTSGRCYKEWPIMGVRSQQIKLTD